MPFHRHHRQVGTRHLLTLGITAANIARLRTPVDSASWRAAPHHSGPIPFVCGPLNCVLRLDTHALPHPSLFAVTLSDEDVQALITEGMREFVGTNVGVVCVYGLTPKVAGEAVRRVLGDE